MPNYDYECANCEKKFELFQNISAERLTNCPECEEPIVLIKNGKEMKEEDCTCCGGYKIDVLHIAIIKVATIKAAAIKAIIRKTRQKLK